MLSRGANILVVDDDPAIAHITTLAMKSFKIDGQPIRIQTATSRAEAEHLMWNSFKTQQGLSAIPVALIGLKLNAEDGGLDLCRYIRKGLDNHETRLYVRYDRPYNASDREIFDQHEISGYYTTADITEDRLYSLIRTGVRHFRTMAVSRTLLGLLDALIAAHSQDKMARVLNNMIAEMGTDATGAAHDYADTRIGFLFDGQVVARHPLLLEAEALTRSTELRQLPGISLNSNGDKYVTDDDYFAVHISADSTHAEFDYICPATGDIPDTFARDFYKFARAAAALWKNAPASLSGAASSQSTL
jgi:CheY-like chemotaxis protein